MGKIVLTYPPDFDGELHIHHSESPTPSGKLFAFRFDVASLGEESAQEALYRVAQDVIHQLRSTRL